MSLEFVSGLGSVRTSRACKRSIAVTFDPVALQIGTTLESRAANRTLLQTFVHPRFVQDEFISGLECVSAFCTFGLSSDARVDLPLMSLEAALSVVSPSADGAAKVFLAKVKFLVEVQIARVHKLFATGQTLELFDAWNNQKQCLALPFSNLSQLVHFLPVCVLRCLSSFCADPNAMSQRLQR